MGSSPVQVTNFDNKSERTFILSKKIDHNRSLFDLFMVFLAKSKVMIFDDRILLLFIINRFFSWGI